MMFCRAAQRSWWWFDSRARDPRFDTGPATYRYSDSRRAVVISRQEHVHKVLVNCLIGLSLLRKSVIRLTDHPNMTILLFTVDVKQHYNNNNVQAGFLMMPKHQSGFLMMPKHQSGFLMMPNFQAGFLMMPNLQDAQFQARFLMMPKFQAGFSMMPIIFRLYFS